MRCFAQRPHFRCLGAPAESGDRAKPVSQRRLSPFNRLFGAGRKCVETSDHVIKRFVRDSRNLVKSVLLVIERIWSPSPAGVPSFVDPQKKISIFLKCPP